MKFSNLQVYKEEYDFIFRERGSGVRKATVISTLIEALVYSLASIFLENHKVEHNPETYQEYSQSINILKVNKILTPEGLDRLRAFRRERNKSIHGIFKGMTRKDWDQQNKIVIDLGRPIVKELNQRLQKEESDIIQL